MHMNAQERIHVNVLHAFVFYEWHFKSHFRLRYIMFCMCLLCTGGNLCDIIVLYTYIVMNGYFALFYNATHCDILKSICDINKEK